MILQFQSSCCGVRLHVNAVFLFSVFPSLLSWPCSASGRQRRGLVRCTRLRRHAPGSGYVTCWQTSHSSLKGQSHQQHYICHIYLSEYRFGHWKGPQSINTQHAVLVHPDHFCISAAGVWLSGNCCCCASITKKALDHSLDHKWYKTWMEPPRYPLVSKIVFPPSPSSVLKQHVTNQWVNLAVKVQACESCQLMSLPWRILLTSTFQNELQVLFSVILY